MADGDWLPQQFEANRPRLQALAYRMLGSPSEADDAVQESWLRLSRSAAAGVDNLSAWLNTVVARVCLDMLRSRKSRQEEPLPPDDALLPDPTDPEHEALLAESVGSALLVVLQRLDPAERVAFVLHDSFGVSFEEIAGIVGRSPGAARQLASRARRRVQGAADDDRATDLARQQAIVEAFFRASRSGNFQALLLVLDPDVSLRGDEAARRMGVPQLSGVQAVAEQFARWRAQAAQPALIDGVPGAVWARHGKPRVVFGFTIENDKIVGIELVADPERLGRRNIELLA